MANKQNMNSQLWKENEELKKQVESLTIRNQSLLEQHIKDAHKMKELMDNREAALKEIDSIYKSHMIDLVELFGEVIEDDDKTILGKRIEFFPAEKLNDHRRFQADVRLEDDRPKVVLGITYDEEEGDGEAE